MDEGLPDLVVGSVIKILGSESRLIYSLVACISFPDNMLLNELHGYLSLFSYWRCVSMYCRKAQITSPLKER